VDQDKLGVQGFKYSAKDAWKSGSSHWRRRLGSVCAQSHERDSNRHVRWKAEKVDDAFAKRAARFDPTVYGLRNLWTKKDLGTTQSAVETPKCRRAMS